MEDKIFITMEEYKELLMIKGRYEELKSQQLLKAESNTNWGTLRGLDMTLVGRAEKEPEFNF